MFWYRFFKFTIFKPLVKHGWGAIVIGSENYPREGGLIMASNHIGALDSLIIPAMLPRPLTFPAKAELFARRPKVAKLVANPRLREYVQDRLSGQIHRADGSVAVGPTPPRWTGQNKPHRKDRGWVLGWSPQQIANRIMITQAVEQRATEAAGEESMFRRTMYPLTG